MARCLLVFRRRRCRPDGVVPANSSDLAVVPIIRPERSILIAFEVDDVGALAFGQVALAAQALGVFRVIVELARPVAPDAPDAEIDDDGECRENQNA